MFVIFFFFICFFLIFLIDNFNVISSNTILRELFLSSFDFNVTFSFVAVFNIVFLFFSAHFRMFKFIISLFFFSLPFFIIIFIINLFLHKKICLFYSLYSLIILLRFFFEYIFKRKHDNVIVTVDIVIEFFLMKIPVSELYISIKINILLLNFIFITSLFVLFIIRINLCLRENDLRLKNTSLIIIKKNILIIVIIKEILY